MFSLSLCPRIRGQAQGFEAGVCPALRPGSGWRLRRSAVDGLCLRGNGVLGQGWAHSFQMVNRGWGADMTCGSQRFPLTLPEFSSEVYANRNYMVGWSPAREPLRKLHLTHFLQVGQT